MKHEVIIVRKRKYESRKVQLTGGQKLCLRAAPKARVTVASGQQSPKALRRTREQKPR